MVRFAGVAMSGLQKIKVHVVDAHALPDAFARIPVNGHRTFERVGFDDIAGGLAPQFAGRFPTYNPDGRIGPVTGDKLSPMAFHSIRTDIFHGITVVATPCPDNRRDDA